MAEPTAKPKRAPRGNEGKGRPKGAKNKINADVKAMVQIALTEEGGVSYLRQQARENPKAFMALLARLIPTKVEGDAENPVQVLHTIKRVIINGDGERRIDD